MTEKWCEFFGENHFLIGISVDGTEEIHNRYRKFPSGEATYKKIAEACEETSKKFMLIIRKKAGIFSSILPAWILCMRIKGTIPIP